MLAGNIEIRLGIDYQNCARNDRLLPDDWQKKPEAPTNIDGNSPDIFVTVFWPDLLVKNSAHTNFLQNSGRFCCATRNAPCHGRTPRLPPNRRSESNRVDPNRQNFEFFCKSSPFEEASDSIGGCGTRA